MKNHKMMMYIGLLNILTSMITTFCLRNKQGYREAPVSYILLIYSTVSWWIMFGYFTAFSREIVLIACSMSLASMLGTLATGLLIQQDMLCLNSCCAQGLSLLTGVGFAVWFKKADHTFAIVVVFSVTLLLTSYLIFVSKALFVRYSVKNEYIFAALRIFAGPIQFIWGFLSYIIACKCCQHNRGNKIEGD